MDEYYWLWNSAYKAALLAIGYGIIFAIVKVIYALYKKMRGDNDQYQKIDSLIETSTSPNNSDKKMTSEERELNSKDLLGEAKSIAIKGSIFVAVLISIFLVKKNHNANVNVEKAPIAQTENRSEKNLESYLIYSCTEEPEMEDGLKIKMNRIYFSRERTTINLETTDSKRGILSTMEFNKCKSNNLINECEFEYDEINYGTVKLRLIMDEDKLTVTLKRYFDEINEKADITMEEWHCNAKVGM